ncbi:gluconate 2-dehydrogenase subunit 3 family protein [Arenibacter sp. F26102]|uniref:gluconate 2-dehydrogenase subunit 3 family protein n=1 Tax=Arenibacter sp. F26102 TaxID=2926416 RepID=UPI001FF2F373|nr:gluconate 2-dehydrogenase subunit 3 family protein [Arenibacter sp. F26102]MCK0144785.1 gluconate 2-dehydrogenase subunit 3 family protein [Arenibacter sp. F26102]
MDRRKSIKSIILGGVAGGLAINGCKPGTEGEAEAADALVQDEKHFGRTPEEKELLQELYAEQFFNEHQLETLGVLCALIIPASGTYGSATDAGVPDFIEFMAKDIPEYQTPLAGGLMWLDHKSNKEYGVEFKTAAEAQQKEILDAIAFPDKENPSYEEEFFSLIRNLTVTGYYTSKEGIEDLGYKGNSPNVWDGVPEDVLAKHGKSYDPEWLAKCVDQSKRNEMAEWDDEGNLLT